MEELGRAPRSLLDEVKTFLELESPFPPKAESAKKNVSSVAALKRNAWVNCVYPMWLSRHPRIPWIIKSPFFHLAKTGSSPITKPRLDEDTENLLKDAFRQDVYALRKFTGQSFDQWRDYE
jgi:hypothetical protein